MRAVRGRSGPTNGSQDAGDRTLELGRTGFAYERTYTAWLRTGLAAFGAGLGARALLGHNVPDWLVRLTSTTLLLISLVMFVASALCGRTGQTAPVRGLQTVPRPITLALSLGLAALAALAAGTLWWR